MRLIEIKQGEYTILQGKIFDSWAELDWRQIAHVLSVFNMPMPSDWSAQTRQYYQNMQILKALNDWTDEDLEHWRDTYLDCVATTYPDSHIIQLSSNGKELTSKRLAYYEWLEDLKNVVNRSIEFAITENTEGRFINQTLFNNPLPYLKFKDKNGFDVRWYAGYSDFEEPFRDATLDELGRIYTLFEQYNDTQDAKYLHEMIAVIYRPGKPRVDRQNEDNDDPRLPLEKSQKLLRVRVAIVRDCFKSGIKELIKLHVVSAMARMKELYDPIFGGKSGSNKGSDFLDFILELSDFNPLDTEGISQKNAHDMLELAVRSIERKKLKPQKTE
jgi:23S rRNA pseudoU1915 N3-methylase RlmH